MQSLRTVFNASSLALLLGLMGAAPTALAIGFDDLEKIEKVERSERKVREAKAEAARREEEARRQAQAQAEEAARQRAASASSGSGGGSSRGRFDPSKVIMVPDGNRLKMYCGSTYSGFVTFLTKCGSSSWSATFGRSCISYQEAVYEAGKDNPNCQR